MGYTKADTISGTGASGSGGSTGGTGTVTSTTSTGYQANATARQLLFDFQHTRNLARQARAEERAAFSNLTKVQADLVLQVKQAFYALAQSARLVSVNEANLRNANDHLALAKARLDAGMGLPSDVVRAETAISEAALALNLAQNASSLAAVTLANAMGIDVRTPLTAADSGEPTVAVDDVNALVDTALRDRPEVQGVQANLDAALAALRASRSTNAPSVVGTLGLVGRDTNFFPHNDSLTVGATVQWSVFDAGATSGRTREAEGNVQTAQALAVTARQNVTVDVTQAYLNLRSAEQRVVTADAEVANALEGVRLAEGRYRSGLGTFIEVTDAQSALLAAQTNKVNAQAAVDVARATMAHAIGSNLR
jgi:outer membrane protein TolC